ncbi:adenylate/guanylate cyclase domain-containing protein [Cerasicoccus maritimus]|uniref:adenylate/guanylate cyclase domain-containing protein n=1 Tax=Cerasicoccus maritimus TaxID=490089 RepID=UPI00285257E8|nr:adenylate/guanylate cyclase domain-containing protein [Cerasicoccus maritimus]
MAANSTGGRWKLLLCLLPIPLFWIFFTEAKFAKVYSQQLVNLAMDWRYKVRGELEAPEVKVIYVDVDAETISRIGERPWSRFRFGQVAEKLFEYGHVSAVGFDLIFSKNSSSELVQPEHVNQSDIEFRKVLSKYPNVVLAANYTQIPLPYTFEERERIKNGEHIEPRYRDMPLTYFHEKYGADYPYTPKTTFPEMPTFPLVLMGNGTNGIGLIAEDKEMSGDTVPRWIPLYAEAEGPYYTLNLLEGYEYFYDLNFNDNFLFEDTEQSIENQQFLRVPEADIIREPTVQVLGNNFQNLGFMPLNTKQTFLHFSIELARKHLGLDPEDIVIEEDRMIFYKDDEPIIELPMVEGQIMEVNWFSRWFSEYNTRASMARIFDAAHMLENGNEAQQKEAREYFDQFKDAIVLIGPTDTTLQDLAPTPFDSVPVPKVGMHGNAIKTIFTGKFIKRLDWWHHALITLVLTYLVAALGTYTGRYNVWMKVGSGLVLVLYVGLVFGSFSVFHLVLPFIAPVASAITTTTAGAVYQLVVEEKQRGRIKGMFGAYLSPDLVNNMVESGEEPQLGGEEVEISAFFSDIQGFSTFSELLPADRLVTLMNEYLTAMTDILQEEFGTLDKYIGDAMVAMFNAPLHVENHALRACMAAARIQTRQNELRDKWAAEGDDWPEIVPKMQTRIGVNTGPAVVGNMGSESRFNYTMMGDTVNLAARSESGAKSYGLYIMVTGETREACMAVSDECVFRYLDKIRVKGRSQPAEMYELVCLKEDMDDETVRCLEIYQKGIDRYLQQDFNGAIEFFEQSVELEPNRPEKNQEAPTTPSDVLLARCLYYLEEPPGENWDGVFVMKTK